MKFSNLFILLFLFSLTSAVYGQQKTKPETGHATIYDDDYEDMLLANGETYRKNTFIAAHPFYAFGTQVRVYCPDTRKTVYVTIKDRGPYLRGSIIELSRKAADKLGISGKKKPVVIVTWMQDQTANTDQMFAMNTAKGGDVPKEYDQLTNKSTFVSAPEVVGRGKIDINPQQKSTYYSIYKVSVEDVGETKRGFGVQIGKYSEYYKLLRQIAILQKKGVQGVMVATVKEKGKDYYKIIVGPYTDKNTANRVKGQLKKRGLKGFIVEM